ncbi:RlpA-like double-psi beta-barrel-protein domain-containing protein-containing protein [Triangularia verruculosa]|uniref:RlpA-like double-psi beta-barrel-protein domain-containing protein-containing protein n=1 Tax=Triangularia verruculosa TaxID=2587418 RepID=A0AAN6XVR1_9PEZI|nr:RlpA-like double-psi beta-barrel-protein domain-containing protein-containing protein [Triangularia verruculosa]
MVSFTTVATGLVAIFASSAVAAPANTAVAASGDFTHYSPSVGLGACGQVHQDSELVVAISYADFDPQTPAGNPNNNPLCGRRLRASFEGKSVDVTVVDRCPSCSSGSLDLSPATFQQLADLGRGRIQGT